MTTFAIGFVFIMIFTVLVGLGAVIFISFDASPSERPSNVSQNDPYNIVRQVNTNTIETVDMAGGVQTWVRMSD